LTFHFGGLVLDSDRRELRLGDKVFAVEPQVFDLLEFLVRNRHRVVSRDDLLAGVWGGRIVSESAIAARINAARRVIGDDGREQRLIRTIARRGFRFVGEVREGAATAAPAMSPAGSALPGTARGQRISYCRTVDGVSIAVGRIGRGLPLVCTPTWSTHIEYDWENPTGSQLLPFLAHRFDLVRYDGRGSGLSDRNIDEVSLATFQRDLEAVVDALKLRRYALLCGGSGCSTAIAHAATYPERVSKMIVHGGILEDGKKPGAAILIGMVSSYVDSVGKDWGSVGLTLLRALVAGAFPGLSPDQVEWCVNQLPLTTSVQNALRHLRAYGETDVVDLLPKVRAPTLVLHCRRNRALPLEHSERLAASIPNARLLSLDSANAVPLPGEPAWPAFLRAIEAFLAEPQGVAASLERLHGA
jgi:DNA-binding winged helix-turn-helix (wHTH) protein/pimeloyl-ACP methyl ester carboxylesterase